jgi:hypothetical protein
MVTDIRKPFGYTLRNSYGSWRLKTALGFLVIYLLLAGCSVKPCYIAVEEKGSKPPVPELRTINFFFDRTNSVSGFVGDVASPTGYNQALDIALVEGEKIVREPGFYEFGEIGIYHILNDTKKMREEVRKREFYAGGRYINRVYTITSSYNPSRDKTRELVRDNEKLKDRHPFSAVLDYITNQENPHETINFVVSDLYEQNGFNESFYRLFSYAFQNGLDGALFAVKSAYNGHISDFTPDPNENPIDVENGESTVFFFITGPGKALQDYCKALSTQLEAANPPVHFDKTIFLQNAGFKASASAADKRLSVNRKAGDEKEFARLGVGFNVNLMSAPNSVKAWQENTPAKEQKKKIYRPVRADAEAYKIANNFKARYVYKTPKWEDYSGSVPEIRDISIVLWPDGKTERGKSSSPFKTANSANFRTPDAQDDERFNYLPIVINSGNLDRGVYRVRFNIVPDWVNFLNAANVAELRTSVEQKHSPIKVLNLRLIYENILREYTAAGGRSAEFYLVKE